MMEKKQNQQESERHELDSLRLASQVRESVENDLRRRYSWLGLVFVFLTSGVFLLLVDKSLRSATNGLDDANRDLTLAKSLQEHWAAELRETAAKAEDISYQAAVYARRLEEKSDGLQENLLAAELRMDVLNRNAIKVQEDLETQAQVAITVSEDLTKQMTELTKIVEIMLIEHEEEANDLKEVQASLLVAQDRIDVEQKRSDVFRVSRLPVEVVNIKGAGDLKDRLLQEGFVASLRQIDGEDSPGLFPNPEEGLLVVIPDGAPVDVAQQILVIAKEEMPGISHIGSDRLIRGVDGFWIGRSILDARRVRPFTEREFAMLLEEGLSQEKFSQIVYSFSGGVAPQKASESSGRRGRASSRENPR